MYEKGIGVRRDANRARGYFHRAAKLGNFEARGRESSLLGQHLGDGTQLPVVVRVHAFQETAVRKHAITAFERLGSGQGRQFEAPGFHVCLDRAREAMKSLDGLGPQTQRPGVVGGEAKCSLIGVFRLFRFRHLIATFA